MSTEQSKKMLIKKAARELFFLLGFNKTNMEDIAKESDMAKATLYYYYASKEAIFDEIVVEEAQMFMDNICNRMPKDLPADEKLAFLFQEMYQGLKEYANKMADMPQYLCEHSPHGHPIVEKINDTFMQKLLPILAEGKSAQIFTFDDAKITAQTLVFLTDFLNLDWMQHYPEDLRNNVIESMIQILLTGLKQ